MQYVNDSCRVVYAYEMPPCPALLEEAKIPPLVLDFPTVEEPNKFSATHTNSEEDIFSSMDTFTKRDVSDINKYMHSGETSGKVTDVQMTELGNDKCWNTSEEPTINEAKTTSSWSDSKKSDSWAGSHAAGQWSQDDSDKLRESLNEVMVDVSGTGRWNQDFAAGHSPSVSNSDWLTGSSVI